MRVKNTLTGKRGWMNVYTWEQGRYIAVFVNDELEFWKQEHVQIVRKRKIVRTVRIIPIRSDPFAAYAENELEELLESTTGYAIAKEMAGRLKRIAYSLLLLTSERNASNYKPQLYGSRSQSPVYVPS